MDLQVAVGVRELANPGLALVDDKAVLCGDFLYSLESLQQLFLAAVDDIGIIRIASEVPEAADDFAEVVHPVWIDNPYVLRLLVSNVHAFAEPLFTCKLRCWHSTTAGIRVPYTANTAPAYQTLAGARISATGHTTFATPGQNPQST